MGKSKDRIALVEPKRIPIDTPEGQPDLEALVFPLGFRHLQKFNAQISRTVMQLATSLHIPKGASEEQLGMIIVSEAIPILMGDMLELLKDCVRFNPNNVSIDDLPHWVVPAIVEEWLIESFGEPEKRDPWKRAIESTVVRFTGKTEFSLSSMASSFLSAPDGPSTPSTDADNPESPTEG